VQPINSTVLTLIGSRIRLDADPLMFQPVNSSVEWGCDAATCSLIHLAVVQREGRVRCPSDSSGWTLGEMTDVVQRQGRVHILASEGPHASILFGVDTGHNRFVIVADLDWTSKCQHIQRLACHRAGSVDARRIATHGVSPRWSTDGRCQ